VVDGEAAEVAGGAGDDDGHGDSILSAARTRGPVEEWNRIAFAILPDGRYPLFGKLVA
jgi:hypothetical protein